MTRPIEADIRPDTDAAEEFAEEVGPDPTQEEINHYQRLEGEDLADGETEDLPAPPAG